MGTGTAVTLLLFLLCSIGGLVTLIWNMQSNRITAIEEDRVREKERRDLRDERIYDKLGEVQKSIENLALTVATDYSRRRKN